MNWRRIEVGLAVAIVAVLVLSGALGARPARAATASWTFALYVSGDNDLAKYWAQDSLPFLENVPASAQVNIVALVSLKNATNDYIEKIAATTIKVVETEPKMDMGIPSTVSWWINKSTTLFPATNYALDIWDHGYGWKYVSIDDLTGHRLSMPQLQQAIAASGKTIAVLGFDACNMGNEEVAYQMAKTNLVSFLVGSEETVPGVGFPYDKMLLPLVNNPAMTPHDFSIAMVNGWGTYYANTTWANTVNLASYDVAALKTSVGAFTTWTSNMARLLSTYKSAYASALKAAYSAWATHYFADLYDYTVHLLATKGVTDASLRAATQTLEASVSSYVVRVWNGPKMTMCGGVTFYFGTGSDWTSSSAVYLQTAFAVDTGWGSFLTSYNG